MNVQTKSKLIFHGCITMSLFHTSCLWNHVTPTRAVTLALMSEFFVKEATKKDLTMPLPLETSPGGHTITTLEPINQL